MRHPQAMLRPLSYMTVPEEDQSCFRQYFAGPLFYREPVLFALQQDKLLSADSIGVYLPDRFVSSLIFAFRRFR